MEPTAPSPAAAALPNQYLTFTLSDQSFAIDILKVQEIKGYTAITPIPNTPPQVKGVMNMRGVVIPIVDLRVKFSIGERTYDKFTVVIIVMVGQKTVGLIVDAVSDVLDIAAAEIRPTPDLGCRVDTRYISGMATAGEHITVLLDLEQLLTSDELLDRAA